MGRPTKWLFERSGSFLSRVERIAAPAISAATARSEDVGVSDEDAAEREIDAVVAAGDESADVARAAAPEAEPMPSAAEIRRLLSGLSVQRTAGGGLVIEAPPETASTLAALFSGMAQLLQACAAPPVLAGDPVARLPTARARPRIDVREASQRR